MKLYVNYREAPILYKALILARVYSPVSEHDVLDKLIARVYDCTKKQHNIDLDSRKGGIYHADR